MINLQNDYIQADVQDMLIVLKNELLHKGINRFAYFRRNGDNIQTPCPFHKNGQERKASFGINGVKNKCHCFTCGWSGGIDRMISALFGFEDGGKYGKKWLIQRFNSVEIETRTNILKDFKPRFKQPQCVEKLYITDEELEKYRYTHLYMYKRGLTDEIIDEFDIGYDKEHREITFPILDLNEKCVFVASRSVDAKFFRLPKDLSKPVYQAYRFKSGRYSQAYICESFLNCLTCWKYGKPAMAMIGTGNNEQYKILESLPVREYILCFDPDDAGRKATTRFKNNVHSKILKEIIYEEDGKDINDLQADFLKLSIKFL